MAPFRGGRGGRGSAKLARSGIRTRAGYKKFDSQRVREIEPVDSEEEEPELEEQEDVDLSEDEAVETAPAIKPYNALLQSFHQPEEQNGRKRKRRKVEIEEISHISGGEESDQSEPNALIEAEGDFVDEEEEIFVDGEGGQSEDEVDKDDSDPFEVHFANPDDNELSRRLKAVRDNEWRVEKQAIPKIASIHVSAPKCVDGNITRKPALRSAEDLPLKQRLVSSAQNQIGSFDSLQQSIAPYLFSYTDTLLGNRTPQNASSLRRLSCLHALNHVLKGRDKVLKNNARISQSESMDLDLRDQGFTRPKVLILLETRQMCVKYADCIIDLFEPEQVENKQRFQSSFSATIDENDTMPEDYQELFGGNNDNNFLTALKFTRKTLRFYAPFYTSDIILASPLGLRRVLEDEDVKKRDYDFLSSIEIILVDQADAMQMQNWENVESVFRHLNLQLREAHGCDFSRVRSWYLDGNAKHLRQTAVFSAYITPEMNRLFNSTLQNVAGKVKLTPSYSEDPIASAGVKQTFSRFESASPLSDPDARFKYFTTTLLPSLLRIPKPADGAPGILIFVPSYYDFLRVRNFFATSTLTQNVSFGAVHDYSDISSQRRARAHFLSGRHGFLLYTQRAHHFYRLRLRGVKRVVMYGLPDDKVFYEELVGGFLGTSVEEGRAGREEVGLRAMFSRWDWLRLERVVGSERVKGMLGGVGDTFDFV